MPKLTLTILKDTFAVCRLDPRADIPTLGNTASFLSITRTSSELSIVCPQDQADGLSECERDWRCLKIEGPLDFSLVGILSALLQPLADAGISIFAVSTFETDYILIKAKDLDRAVEVLQKSGYNLKVG